MKRPKSKLLILNFVGMALLLVPLAVSADGGPVREGLRLWLDASDAATVEVCSNAVTRWRDKSGANNHAKAVGAPTLLERDFNAHPALRLSGRECFQVSPVIPEIIPQAGSL